MTGGQSGQRVFELVRVLSVRDDDLQRAGDAGQLAGAGIGDDGDVHLLFAARHGSLVGQGETPGFAVQFAGDALDGEETFEVDAELEAVLLESIAQGERGETISADELLRELRSRE